VPRITVKLDASHVNSFGMVCSVLNVRRDSLLNLLLPYELERLRAVGRKNIPHVVARKFREPVDELVNFRMPTGPEPKVIKAEIQKLSVDRRADLTRRLKERDPHLLAEFEKFYADVTWDAIEKKTKTTFAEPDPTISDASLRRKLFNPVLNESVIMALNEVCAEKKLTRDRAFDAILFSLAIRLILPALLIVNPSRTSNEILKLSVFEVMKALELYFIKQQIQREYPKTNFLLLHQFVELWAAPFYKSVYDSLPANYQKRIPYSALYQKISDEFYYDRCLR